ncbi:hypothetical protein GPX89_19735 [Nocardia sp. ET3-3]|uniref:Uncharacterized protein n=1 Tax=Nocardia terrae TaxID=2675851 RepID=A0A7K1UYY5_9NOCA|nr:hypothetical protein [Nocardia terrae]MVU79467.1 hypothetical protein [Nocardia terrae]
MVAVNTLLAAVPLTDRRRRIRRAEQLAKLVSAAGDGCPKVLRANLMEEIRWVAAYSEIRYTTRDRTILWFGWVLAVVTTVCLFALGAVFKWYRSPSPILYNGPTIGFALMAALQILPAAIILDWMNARRLMYVKLGGRAGLPALRRPSLRRRSVTSGVIKMLIARVFGDLNPNLEAIKTSDILALRHAVAEWEAKPRSWSRSLGEGSDR